MNYKKTYRRHANRRRSKKDFGYGVAQLKTKEVRLKKELLKLKKEFSV